MLWQQHASQQGARCADFCIASEAVQLRTADLLQLTVLINNMTFAFASSLSISNQARLAGP
jgi:hypothetical protein